MPLPVAKPSAARIGVGLARARAVGGGAASGSIGGLRRAAGAVPPSGLILLAIGSFQIGAAAAKSLFAEVGPAGTVLLRMALAALVLLLVQRPRVRGYGRDDYLAVTLLGLALVGMSLGLFIALERIPLGVAIAVQFAGPLGVAVAGSRRPSHLLWVALAAAGIGLLAPWGGGDLDPGGIALSLAAGGCWAAYILLSRRVGRVFPGGSGLALAMVVAALAAAPFGVISGGGDLVRPSVLATAGVVALLSSVIPFSLEFAALRRVPARLYAVLVSLDPAIAALVGFVLLGEDLGSRAVAAIALVTAAAFGAMRADAS